MSIHERVQNADAHIEHHKHEQRLEQKIAREQMQRQNQRRNYIIGEMVSQYFPEVMSLEPGTQAENEERFLPLRAFLIELAADRELVEQIKEKARSWQQPGVILEQDELQCVSGHAHKG